MSDYDQQDLHREPGQSDEFRVSNDKGSSRPRRPRTAQADIRQILNLRIDRRDFLAGAMTATALPTSVLLAGCEAEPVTKSSPKASSAPSSSNLTFTEVPYDTVAEDVLPPGYSRRILISWGDPLHADAEAFDPARQTAASAGRQFGYNNDHLAYVPIDPAASASEHGLLVVNHEYPLPWLMWDDLDKDSAAARMTREQVDVTMAAVGLSVLEVKREGDQWRVVGDSRFNRRVSMFTPIDFSGPARGHPRMQTSGDPDGQTVIGTHDNCNGGITPWGTVLSCEEGSSDFFAGDYEKSPDKAHLERYYYDEQSETGEYGWGRFHPRLNFEQEMNEPNRFEWVVEVDPFEPGSPPVKRTALGRFAHEGAHTVLNGDGRVVVFMGDDWEFEYIYRFVSDGRYDPDNRAANRDLLDAGTLSVAQFDDSGTLRWLPIRFGDGPLTPANGFTDHGDVMIQTRRAADLLGATPMDAPEGFVSNPLTGVLFLALTQNRDRKANQVSAPNPRANNEYGHMLELLPPSAAADGNEANGVRDYAAERFDWSLLVLCGDRADAAPFHPDTAETSRFTDPDNLSVDPLGRLWVCSDDGNGARDALYAMQTEGPERNLSRRFYLPALESECCSPAFTPDGRTLFLAVQHPGEEAGNLQASVTQWPGLAPGQPPRPSVIAITRDDGGVIGS
ncbi:MAG: PhoX family phosphatase [Pseudomonadota bacterium]